MNNQSEVYYKKYFLIIQLNRNLYHYAGNNPVRYVDLDGRTVETAWDAFNTALDVSSFISNISSGNYIGAALI